MWVAIIKPASYAMQHRGCAATFANTTNPRFRGERSRLGATQSVDTPMHKVLSLAILATVFLTLSNAWAEDEEKDDALQDGRPVVHTSSPQDVYEAKLSMLESRVEAKRNYCKATGAKGLDYCSKEADQMEREGESRLKAELKAALAKQPAP